MGQNFSQLEQSPAATSCRHLYVPAPASLGPRYSDTVHGNHLTTASAKIYKWIISHLVLIQGEFHQLVGYLCPQMICKQINILQNKWQKERVKKQLFVRISLTSWSLVECHYNVVQFIMIFHMTLRWQQQDVYQTWTSQQTPHTSPSRVSYGESIVRIWGKTDCVITAPYCIGNHSLTQWGRVTQICVGNLTIIGSDNSLSPGRRQAIIWTNAGI